MATDTIDIEHRRLEMFDALGDDFVDPRDAYTDGDGQWWLPVGSVPVASSGAVATPLDEGQLRELRGQCRRRGGGPGGAAGRQRARRVVRRGGDAAGRRATPRAAWPVPAAGGRQCVCDQRT